MKNAEILIVVVSSALLLTGCASQGSGQQVAPPPTAAATPAPATAAALATPNPTNGAPAVTVVGDRYRGTRRVVKDGVEYFCERPAQTGSRFIAQKEQCYTEEQLKVVRERDQDFLRRQQAHAAQTNPTAVTRTPLTP